MERYQLAVHFEKSMAPFYVLIDGLIFLISNMYIFRFVQKLHLHLESFVSIYALAGCGFQSTHILSSDYVDVGSSNEI